MKKFFQRYLPPIAQIKSHPSLQFFGKRLHDPNLWHLNRRSVAGGTAIGLFSAFILIPLHTVLAALLAILFRVNLPLAIALVWITNPITMPPIIYFDYLLGSILLRIPLQPLEFQFSSQWFLTTLKPFLLGCIVLSTVSALAGYWVSIGLWRLQVNRLWRNRCRKRLQPENTLIKPKKVRQIRKFTLTKK
jgi:uncharacterized protein